MNQSRIISFSVLVSAVVFGLPAMVSAQASVTTNPSSNPTGVVIPAAIQDFGSYPSAGRYTFAVVTDAWQNGGVTGNNSAYWWNSHSPYCSQCAVPNACASKSPVTVSNGYKVCTDGNMQNGYPKDFYIKDHNGLQGSPTTATRMCKIADTYDSAAGGFTADTDVRSTSVANYHEGGNQDENTLLFNGSRWFLLENNRYYYVPGYVGNSSSGSDLYDNLASLTCASFDPPKPTLTASTYNVTTPGQAVALTWGDVAYSDNLGGSGNVCTASGFAVPTTPVTYCASWTTQCNGGGPGSTVEASANLALASCQQVCDFYQTDQVPAKSGTVTVNPSTTTTYTYSCTNPNGTTIASATVNVTQPTPPPTATLTATPTSITSGGSSKLTWSSTNATSCAASTFSTGNATSNSTGVTVSPTTSTTYGITCTGLGGSATSYATVNVSAPLAADLSPVSLVPTQVTANQVSTFTATLKNGGTAATPQFSSTIYVCSQNDAACMSNPMARSLFGRIMAFLIPTAQAASSIKITLNGPPIPAGQNGTQTGTYNFANNGSYQMRLCADLPLNQVSEPNEDDNCGNWQLLVVGPSTLAGACSVSPSSGFIGTTFTWGTSGVSGGNGSYAYSWSGDEGLTGTTPSVTKQYSSAGTKSGTVAISSTGSTTLTPTCSPAVVTVNACYGAGCGPGGGCPTSGTCGCTVPALGCYPTPQVPTATLNVTPNDIDVGQSATITWGSTGATSCSGTSPITSATSGAVSTGTLNNPGVQSYQVQCSGPGGISSLQTATVMVEAPSATISANPARVPNGSSSTITYRGVGVKSCTVTGPAGTIASGSASGVPKTYAGTASATITAQSLFSISCTTNGANVSNSVIVNVAPGFNEF